MNARWFPCQPRGVPANRDSSKFGRTWLATADVAVVTLNVANNEYRSKGEEESEFHLIVAWRLRHPSVRHDWTK